MQRIILYIVKVTKYYLLHILFKAVFRETPIIVYVICLVKNTKQGLNFNYGIRKYINPLEILLTLRLRVEIDL